MNSIFKGKYVVNSTLKLTLTMAYKKRYPCIKNVKRTKQSIFKRLFNENQSFQANDIYLDELGK